MYYIKIYDRIKNRFEFIVDDDLNKTTFFNLREAYNVLKTHPDKKLKIIVYLDDSVNWTRKPALILRFRLFLRGIL